MAQEKKEDQQNLGCFVGTAKSSDKDGELLAATVLMNFWGMLMYGQMLTVVFVSMQYLK